jgi:hypothetical protein
MSAQTIPTTRSLTRSKREAKATPERVDSPHLTEQTTGPVTLRAERTAAEILGERLAEADPAATTPVFVP